MDPRVRTGFPVSERSPFFDLGRAVVDRHPEPDRGVSETLCKWLGVTPRTWSVELGVSRHE